MNKEIFAAAINMNLVDGLVLAEIFADVMEAEGRHLNFQVSILTALDSIAYNSRNSSPEKNESWFALRRAALRTVTDNEEITVDPCGFAREARDKAIAILDANNIVSYTFAN
jgi:hypothetical protein